MPEDFIEASANVTGHNHLTRDIKPRGVCPECDRMAEDDDDVVPLVPVDTAERVGDGRTVLRPSNSPCRKHGIRGCPKC